ncbi:carboxypeptidase-like regulatory domain-containing protein [Arthrospiribacter ruber]|uniref:TonB-dependent receptor n=1 Tax=Arthrospiribacter ruber TaxID=2487934 RepID=A0A951IZB6_9BACT|nr:carboxypeptidase-like regulatory domain-containing protein [Arthrospiribacter ruber]MBW3469024.1 TonB-dependent receptor [Arthrospiribacter ruber]
MKHLLSLFALLLIANLSLAQGGSISGKVIDAQTNEPLPFCNVFINNSTIATTTDFDGNYLLTDVPVGDFDLGFSFMGYEAIQKSASVKDGSKLTFNISLVPLDQELSDVEIKAKRDKSWERELRKFKNYFLGSDDLAAQSEIINPWVIDFPDDNSNNNFRAEAFQPIEIENRALGYKLTFDLKQFQYTSQFHVIAGATRFEELEAPDPKTKANWEKNRLDTYLKSPANMFRAMLDNTHNQEGFFLYGDKAGGSESRNLRTDIFANELGNSIVEYKPDNLVQAGKKEGEYRIFLKGRIEIHYEKGFSNVNTYRDAPYPISWLEVNGNYVHVNANGMVVNEKDVTFSGDMDKRKVSSMLPFDYKPNLSDRLQRQMVRDAGSLQEKVYLHTDRDFYYQGDPVFFKAYFRYANPDYKRDLSKILHVEVISSERDIVLKKKFKIENGLAVGEFFLPDTLKQQEYYLRAYTNWNRNYGPDSYFVKALPVVSVYDRVLSADKPDEEKGEASFTFALDKDKYGKREKVKVEISLTGPEGRPLAANLSASVKDTYFSPLFPTGITAISGMDFVNVPDHITPEKFSYPLETSWNVEGRFTNEKGKGVSTPFTVFLNNFEGSFDLESDKEGNFTLEEMEFYGPMDFSFMALDKKGKGFGTFQLTEKMNPPFSIPAHLKMPDITQTATSIFSYTPEEEETVQLETVEVATEKESAGSRAIYGRADYVIKGENLNRNGTVTDLLMSLKAQVPGMSVTTMQEIRIRGGALSANLSMEPLVMIDGSVMPSGPGVLAASNIGTVNPNDIDRIEVVSRTSSMMGDLGRNGVIAIYLKKGISPMPAFSLGSPGMSNMIIEGFGMPSNFVPFDYDTAEESPELDERVTLYWNPYMVTESGSGKATLEFYTNDTQSPKYLVVEGLDINGNPVRGTLLIPAAQD